MASNMNGGGEVLLVFPGQYRAHDPQVPLSMVHVASPLKRAGFDVRILEDSQLGQGFELALLAHASVLQ